MNINALINTLGTQARSLPLVILYVTEGCNLRCVTCSYRTPLPNELSFEEISRLARALKEFGLRHIVYSGGEPLLRRDLPAISGVFRELGVTQSLLTNGVLLEKRREEISPFLREIIVSIDGPDQDTHDGIRGGTSFNQIVRGIESILRQGERPRVSLRTVVQKRNFRSLGAMVRFGRDLGIDRISFLAADVLSDSFGRAASGPPLRKDDVTLTGDETGEFRHIVGRMVSECEAEFSSGFIAESPRKMHSLVDYFEALLGLRPFPVNLCNAPMVSAVITSTGTLMPCFFLPPFADVRGGDLPTRLNCPAIRKTRSDVRERKLDRCRTCVCTLHVSSGKALLDRF